MDVLTVLAEVGGLQRQLLGNSRELADHQGGITSILDRLEIRGLVKRMPSRNDRRIVQVRLSAQRTQRLRKLYPELARSNRALFERVLRPEPMRELAKSLDLPIRGLEAQSES